MPTRLLVGHCEMLQNQTNGALLFNTTAYPLYSKGLRWQANVILKGYWKDIAYKVHQVKKDVAIHCISREVHQQTSDHSEGVRRYLHKPNTADLADQWLIAQRVILEAY